MATYSLGWFVMAHTGRLSEAQQRRDEQHQREIWMRNCPALLGMYDAKAAEVVSLREALAARDGTIELVRRMVIYGPGEGTTAEETLATVAAFVEKRQVALAGAVVEGAAE